MKFLWSKSRELLDFIPRGLKADYWIFVVKRRRWLKKVAWALCVTIFLAAIGAGVGWYYMYQYTGWDPWIGGLVDDHGQPLDLEKLGKADFLKSSYVYAKNGDEIGKYFLEIRDQAKLEEVPEVIQNAFIAAEDKRFYQHSGIDIFAIASATTGNTLRKVSSVKVWQRSGGASTITQQLARLIYAENVADFKNRSPTLGRKLKEARLAIQLERRYTKKQILEAFLNLVWLGHGANGVATADQRYWGKNIRKDPPTILEAAILASLNKNSGLYDPIPHEPDEPAIDDDTSEKVAKQLREEYKEKLKAEGVRQSLVKDRINFVLGQMRDMGDISEKEYQDNRLEKDDNIANLARLKPWKNPAYMHINRNVKEFMLTQGVTEEEISQKAGLRTYTTIDSEIQNGFTEEFVKHLAFLNEELTGEEKLDGAFIVIENATGNILAAYGGSTEYNRMYALRSPGSGIKPLVYAAALEKGFDYFDQVCNCSFSMRGAKGKIWTPRNFQDKNPQPTGNIDLARGVIWSLNLLTLDLAKTITMDSVIKTAHNMGVHGNPGIVRNSDGEIWFRRPGYEIRGGIEPTLPSAIGASGVNLVELAVAYSVFFRQGIYKPPTLIKEIRNSSGEIIYTPKPFKDKRVLSENTTEKILGMMRAVTKIGTAKISMKGFDPVACKTGTSNGPKDVSIWCGTPELFIGIRIGYDNFEKNIELPQYMRKVSGDPTMLPTGGWLVGSLARKMLNRRYANRKIGQFSENVENNKQILLDRYQGVR